MLAEIERCAVRVVEPRSGREKRCTAGATMPCESHRPQQPARSSPVEWCNRFVSFGLGYALSWSGGSSCWVGWGVSRDLVRMSRLR